MKKKSLIYTTPAEALGECLQWCCSPRGGNNFFGRIMNGCGRKALEGLGTCGVNLDKQGRYVMAWDPSWFIAQPQPFQLLAIVHEATHLMLRHVERGIIIKREMMDEEKAKKLHEVINIAMDMCVNDTALRSLVNDHQMNFKEYKKWLIWPEDREYPKGKQFEEYLAMLLADLKKHGWDPNNPSSEVPLQISSPGQQPGKGEGEKDDKKDGQGAGQPGGQGDGQDEDKKKEKGNGSGEGDGQPDGQGDGQDDGQGGLPKWFKDLLNRKHFTVDWSEIFDSMSDGEMRRVLDRAKREAKKITRQAVNQTKKSRGTIPGGMESIVEDLLADPIIPWQIVLRNMLRSEISSKLNESTALPNISLINRDDLEPFPGYQPDFTFNILAAFDTSGSMSQADFIDCCVELRGLLEREDGVTVRLLHFDWNIQHEEELTSDDVAEMKRSYTRHGHGGTSFDASLRYALNNNADGDWAADAHRESQHGGPFDLMLLFTDGYAPVPLPDLDPKIPLFWVLTENGKQDELMKFVLWMK